MCFEADIHKEKIYKSVRKTLSNVQAVGVPYASVRAVGQTKKIGKNMPNYWLARETAIKYLRESK